MISKETFVRVINKIKETYELSNIIENTVEKCNDKLGVDYFSLYGIYHVNTDLVIELLEEVFDDKETAWVSYYVWEVGFGEKWKPGMITDSDGSDIKLEVAGDLYNLLVSNMKDKEH